MSLPPLQLRSISTSEYLVSGNVTVAAGAAIAPGVILQADADSQIVIQSGVCIGIGTVLHAHQGLIEIQQGANVGAEVLLVGRVTIGRNACIGAATTILNTTIAPSQLVPPGSLLGELSQSDADSQVDELQVTNTVVLPAEDSGAAPVDSPALNGSSPSEPSTGVSVYGQMYVNQLLVKMFPNSRRTTTPDQPTLEKPAEDPWDD